MPFYFFHVLIGKDWFQEFLTSFSRRGGNILDLDEHVDIEGKFFFARVRWDMKNFSIPKSEVIEAFAPLAKEFNAKWEISFTGEKISVAIFVSKYDHCLQEILWRHSQGEFNIDMSLIISNHEEHKTLADHYNIPFFYFPD